MTLHFCVRIGSWKFQNWHVYQYREHHDEKTISNRWMSWEKVI